MVQEKFVTVGRPSLQPGYLTGKKPNSRWRSSIPCCVDLSLSLSLSLFLHPFSFSFPHGKRNCFVSLSLCPYLSLPLSHPNLECCNTLQTRSLLLLTDDYVGTPEFIECHRHGGCFFLCVSGILPCAISMCMDPNDPPVIVHKLTGHQCV